MAVIAVFMFSAALRLPAVRYLMKKGKIGELLKKSFRIFGEEGVRAFFKKTVLYILRRTVNLPGIGHVRGLIVRHRLTRLIGGIQSVEEAYRFASSFRYMGTDIRAAQIREEIVELLRLLRDLKPMVILEIGTANGGSLFLFTMAADPGATILSLDLPGGRFGGGYPAWKSLLYRSFARRGQEIHLIRSDSHNPLTLSKINKILTGRKIDFLFLDGDHTYEGVKRDFEMYGKLVKREGVVAFHDIVPHLPETGCEVSKFWSEVRNKYGHKEIVQDQKQRWAGIGIIYV